MPLGPKLRWAAGVCMRTRVARKVNAGRVVAEERTKVARVLTGG